MMRVLILFFSLAVATNSTDLRSKSLTYLKVNAPSTDAGKDFSQNVDLAIEARNANEWAQQVPEDLFFAYVVPYANIDEPRDDWRPKFVNRLSPLVADTKTIEEAATLIRTKAWTSFPDNKVHFKGDQSPQILSPSQTLAHGYASCSGLSIFLVDAFRAVGIPARIVGTALWNQESGGNHLWVEVHLSDGWHYLDADPSNPVLDKAWFDGIASMACCGETHGIFAVDWGAHDYVMPTAWDTKTRVTAVDRTHFYAPIPKVAWNAHAWVMPSLVASAILILAGATYVLTRHVPALSQHKGAAE